jgi:tripartite-type tricarboxylate transporter receptor subunit TctC
MKARNALIPLLSSAAILAGGSMAAAEDAAAFFEDAGEISMIISSSPGGGYDAYGRLIADYMSRHLPGEPDVIVQNMPGGGGMRAANYLANAADTDGTVISMMARGVPVAPLLYGAESGAEFDPSAFGWIGSLNSEVGVGLVSTASEVGSIDEAKTREIFFGSSGVESTPSMYGRLLNTLAGTQLTMLNGYAGQTEYFLAMERGETDGMFITGWSGPNRVKAMQAHEAGEIRYIVQLATEPHPEFGDTPTLLDVVQDADDQQVIRLLLAQLELGRPVIAPPGVPEDRLEVLREAFRAAVADPEFLEAASRLELDIEPIFGEEAEEMMAAVYRTPESVIARAREIVTFTE